MKKTFLQHIFIIFLSITLFISCSPTKYVPSGSYIVDEVEIKISNGDISTGKMKKIAQPAPLKKILGLYAFRARVYNLLDPAKSNDRKTKKENKIKRKNNKIDLNFQKDNKKLLDKRNFYDKKMKEYYQAGDTLKATEAKLKSEELDKQYNYKSVHSKELLDNLYKQNVFTIPDFITKNGQKPEIYDTVLVNYTKRQFKVYLRNQGYFNASVKDTVIKLGFFKKKRVKIIYTITPGTPLTIGNVIYNYPDSTNIKQVIENNKALQIKTGKKIDVDELENFRTNLTTYYRNNGYYYFSKQLISFQIDTINNKYDNATLIVNFNDNVDKSKVYSTWKIRNIRVFNDFSPNLALQDANYFDNLNTNLFTSDEGYSFFMTHKHKEIIKSKYISKEIYIFPDSLYKLNSTKTTYSHLSKFKIYKLTNIQFSEVSGDSANLLDCDIRLTPDNMTGLNFDIVATRNSLNFGGAANAAFSHKNLFRGGEILDMMFEVALEHQQTEDTVIYNFFNTQEYNFDLKLTIPRLLIPFKSNNFIKRNNPKTVIATLFSYQNRPEYNRIQALIRMDYYLKSSDFSNHIITPVRISSIKADLTPEFQEWVERAMLQESYEDHFIIGSNYSFTYTNQGMAGNTFYFQSNNGVSGNILYGLMKAFNADTVGDMYVLPFVESQFAQFIKSDFDFRYIFKGNEQQLVTRIFVGAGVPFGNSKLLPFGEKFFVGGANSIRAWQARTLGPGQYVQPDKYKYINQTADIKIEFNIEYRFNIISFLEGAVFVDIGNIWNINSYDTRSGGVFFLNTFYKQLAYGTGFGARLNLGYFVFRTDIGVKISDPANPATEKFVLINNGYSTQEYIKKNTVLNIAIGYPF
ncbi:MAG: BamA/TamA family outer membrane protein [Bacteroidales bacterium]|nr:BamA/TamA family outer membrane protein [Bacteroidales bacterium]